VRNLGQILLVIVLGEIELRRRQDLGGDLAKTALRKRLLVLGLRGLCGDALRLRERIDAGAVLRAHVVALAHALRGIVAFPKRLEQPFVADLLGVVDDENDLVMPGMPGAHLLIGRVRRQAARIADGGDPYAVGEAPELALGTPEAA
jgi:hypothetical protein